jgi:hypothetical protein
MYIILPPCLPVVCCKDYPMASPSRQCSPRSDPNQQRARHVQAFLLFVRYAILDIIRRSGIMCYSTRPRSIKLDQSPKLTHIHGRFPRAYHVRRFLLGGTMWTQLSREIVPSCVKSLDWRDGPSADRSRRFIRYNSSTVSPSTVVRSAWFSRSLQAAASRRNSRVFAAGTGRSNKSRNGATSCRGW